LLRIVKKNILFVFLVYIGILSLNVIKQYVYISKMFKFIIYYDINAN
jgi:hypothetical protein